MTDPQRQIAALHYAAACVEQGAENEQALLLGFPANDLFATKAALYAIAADLRRQADALREQHLRLDDAPRVTPEPPTIADEQAHEWQQVNTLTTWEGTGDIDANGDLDMSERKIRVLYCAHCHQTWPHA